MTYEAHPVTRDHGVGDLVSKLWPNNCVFPSRGRRPRATRYSSTTLKFMCSVDLDAGLPRECLILLQVLKDVKSTILLGKQIWFSGFNRVMPKHFESGVSVL